MAKDKSNKKNEPTKLDKNMAKDPNYLKKLEVDMLNAEGLIDDEDDQNPAEKEKEK